MNTMNRLNTIFIYLFLLLLLGLILSLVYFLGNIQSTVDVSLTEKTLSQKLALEKESEQKLHYDLVDATQSPQPIHDAVILGYNILLNTPKYASAYVTSQMSCTNCHFAGGNNTGGNNTGISLAGVAATYPKYNRRSETVIELNQRINDCFERSLNGKPLPLNSLEMNAIVTYLHWISKGMPIYSEISWLGLPELEKTHIPNPENGKKVYETYCAMCHGKNGEGEQQHQIPPLWGENSFNDGAGMNVEETLASFIYYNMPYLNAPLLSTEETWDVASFIIQQPRPHFNPQPTEEPWKPQK